jgi:hypothetical protein
LAVGFSAAIGIFFGFYPDKKSGDDAANSSIAL